MIALISTNQCVIPGSITYSCFSKTKISKFISRIDSKFILMGSKENFSNRGAVVKRVEHLSGADLSPLVLSVGI